MVGSMTLLYSHIYAALELGAQVPESLLVVVISWADAGHHQCLGVASEGGLQEPRQLGVTVGDVLGSPIHQR